MFDIVVCSNDSRFLGRFSKELTAKLAQYAPRAVRVRGISPIQTSLYDVQTPPDLYIVELGDEPDRSMEFIERLRLSAKTDVMVIAPGPDWAMRAYNAEVLFYLLSPPDLDRVAELILRRLALRGEAKGAKAAENTAAPTNLFAFRTSSGTQVVSIDHIVYVEYSDHRLLIYLDSGKRLATTTMRLPSATPRRSFCATRALCAPTPRSLSTLRMFPSLGIMPLPWTQGPRCRSLTQRRLKSSGSLLSSFNSGRHKLQNATFKY